MEVLHKFYNTFNLLFHILTINSVTIEHCHVKGGKEPFTEVGEQVKSNTWTALYKGQKCTSKQCISIQEVALNYLSYLLYIYTNTSYK